MSDGISEIAYSVKRRHNGPCRAVYFSQKAIVKCTLPDGSRVIFTNVEGLFTFHTVLTDVVATKDFIACN